MEILDHDDQRPNLSHTPERCDKPYVDRRSTISLLRFRGRFHVVAFETFEQFVPRPKWRRHGEVVASSNQDQAALLLSMEVDGLHERRLADTSFAADQNKLPRTSTCPIQGIE